MVDVFLFMLSVVVRMLLMTDFFCPGFDSAVLVIFWFVLLPYQF